MLLELHLPKQKNKKTKPKNKTKPPPENSVEEKLKVHLIGNAIVKQRRKREQFK